MLMSKSGYSFWLKRLNPEGLNQGQFVPPLPGDTGRSLGTFVVVTPGVPSGIKTWDAAKHPTMHRTPPKQPPKLSTVRGGAGVGRPWFNPTAKQGERFRSRRTLKGENFQSFHFLPAPLLREPRYPLPRSVQRLPLEGSGWRVEPTS